MDLETITGKLVRSPGTQFGRAVLAGAYISFGAMLMIACKAEGMPSIVCGIAFSLGLWLVVSCNGELFTGNCLLIPYMGFDVEIECVEDGKPKGGKTYKTTLLVMRNLFLSLLGNAVGALFIALVSSKYVDQGTLSAIVEAKTSATPFDVIVKGALCNIAICLAVHVASGEEGAVGRLVSCMLPVALFIACGWEHSIADMFFVMAAGDISTSALVLVSFAVVGNYVGGGLVARMLLLTNEETVMRIEK